MQLNFEDNVVNHRIIKKAENPLIVTSSPMHKSTIWQRKLTVCW